MVLALAAVLLASAASAGPYRSVENTTAFHDNVREDLAGPDITTVTVSSDGNGLTFRVEIPTNPVVTPDLRVRIWLDVDDSDETGLQVEGATGFDHFLLLDPIDVSLYGLPLVGLFWCETANTCSRRATPEFSYESGPTITVDISLLDPALRLQRIERVRFSVSVIAGIRLVPGTGYDFTDTHFDQAPDEGGWTFDARALRVASFRATPARPLAGKPLTLTLGVLRTDTGTTLTGGVVACSLRIAGTRVPARTKRFVAQGVTCAFDIPAGTAGRRFRATIGVAARGDLVRRSLSGRVG